MQQNKFFKNFFSIYERNSHLIRIYKWREVMAVKVKCPKK